MARITPCVEGDILLDRAGAAQPIVVGTPAWYAWLERATTFAFNSTSSHFTARKERRGRADGYWRAYRKRGGKVFCAYLGKSADLTLERLQDAAAALAENRPARPTDTALHDLGADYLGQTSRPGHLFEPVTPNLSLGFPPLRFPAHRPHNLPVPSTPLIGRAQDVAVVVATLQREEVRLLTLTGPGGVGKTRLGLQAAAELRDVFADGVFLVDLSALRDPDFVVPTIVHTLGVSDIGGQALLTHLCNCLVSKQQLLLLDNFEQVLPAGASLAVLLAAAPGLKLLVTSRAVLHLAGEHEILVMPLALPDRQMPPPPDQVIRTAAVVLFIQRAQAVRPDFAVTAETAPLVAEICQRLDGLPLAIELAAARSKLFPPAVLLQRLEKRLPLLTGGARDLPARQQTLRDTIDWSYQLLDRTTQTLLQQLGVFASGFTLDAAEAVCGDFRLPILDYGLDAEAETIPNPKSKIQNVLEGLAALADQSLLQLIHDGVGSPRFMMLETLREYALERLEQSGDAPALRQGHAAYYLRLAEQVEPDLRGTDRRVWLDQLEGEHANLRAALTWALAQGATEVAARLASALGIFWDVRHRREGRDWLAAALASGAALPPAVRAKALHTAGWLARAQYDQAVAITLLEESLALYRDLGDERGSTAVMTDLGWTLATLGSDMARAICYLEEGLARYRALGDGRGIARALQGLGWVEQHRALGDRRGIAWALTGLGWVEQQPGILAAAHALHLESLDFARAVGDVQAIAWSLQSLGITAAAQRDYAAARAFEEERLAIERAQDNRHGIADALRVLGMIAIRQNDDAAAHAWLVESLELARAIGDKSVTAFAFRGLGEMAYAAGDHARASIFLEEALAFFRELNDSYRMAQVYAVLAQVALDQQDSARARTLATQSIQLAQSVDNPETISACLAGLGDSAAHQGRNTWAAQLWGAAERQLEATLTQRAPVKPAHRPQLLEAARMSLGGPVFAAAWAAGRALTPEEALAAPDLSSPALVSIAAGAASRRPAPAPRPAGLTRRELEVLLLVAEDLSRTQIAERMVISPATVKTYLNAIYRKLGIASRMAAMRYVIDHHLQ
jgi:predicted ATPase/DNA-binding CsgD family transcriptional regulator